MGINAGINKMFDVGFTAHDVTSNTPKYGIFAGLKCVPNLIFNIVTGDLGQLGHDVVVDLMDRDGFDMTKNYTDCGLMLFDREKQDMHAGGSGAGCSASVLNGYLLRGMQESKWDRIVFAPTGALLSPTSSFQGESIPAICHAVVLSRTKQEV